MPSKFLNLSTDDTLGGNSPSDDVAVSQKAIKKYVDDHGGGGGTVSVDNKSITTNASDQLQTIGVINQNDTTTALKVWSGDEAYLPAIKDANTFYVTEETVSVSLLDVLYPVGSIYTTTNAACPLSTLIAGSTWVQETSRILVDKGGSGTEWWELYSDGWCRQGGIIQMSGSAVTKTLLKSYKDTNYNVLLTCGSNTSSWPIAWTRNFSKTNSSFFMDGTGTYGGADRTIQVNWQACGYTSTTTSHKQFRRTA